MTTQKHLLFTVATVVLCGIAADTLASVARVVYSGSNHCWVEDAQGNKLCEAKCPGRAVCSVETDGQGNVTKASCGCTAAQDPGSL